MIPIFLSMELENKHVQAYSPNWINSEDGQCTWHVSEDNVEDIMTLEDQNI